MTARAVFAPLRVCAPLVLLLAMGCQSQPARPEAASAAGQASYAERYPDRLTAASSGMGSDEAKVTQSNTEFVSYPDQLKKPDYAAVKKVYELADQAGKASSYASAAADAETVSGFYSSNKDEISRQVAGGARRSAKEKGGEDHVADAAGAGAVYGLDKGLTKQMETSLNSSSDAVRYIEDHEEELGKPNQETLTKQANAISYAAYVVYVKAPQQKEKLEKLVSDAEEVKKTLDRVVKEAADVDADAQASAKKKKATKARGDAAAAARAKVDDAEKAAKEQLKDLEKRQQDLKAAYEKALKDLLAATDKLKSGTEATASAQ